MLQDGVLTFFKQGLVAIPFPIVEKTGRGYNKHNPLRGWYSQPHPRYSPDAGQQQDTARQQAECSQKRENRRYFSV